MIKGIIFVVLTQGGPEVEYPAMRYFTSMEQCEQKAQEALPMFISQLNAFSARYTCELVEG